MEDIHLLKASFDAFQQSSARLQEVYGRLQEKIVQVGLELEEKNAELSRINAERENMKNYLRGILENLTAGILVTDGDGGVKIANRAAQNILSAREEDLQGVHIRQIFDGMEPGKVDHILNGHSSGHAGHRITLNGRVLEIFSSRITTVDGKPSDTAWVMYDMTGTLKLEKQARYMEKNAAMLEMAARIAHEVRNPLGSIELFSSLLMRSVREAKQRDWVDRIIQSVKNIDQKIEELLRHAKTVEPLMEMMNVHDLLKEVLLYSDQISDQGHVFLSVEYDSAEPVIRGNPVMIRQIFMGLILNALKSLPEEGRIHIRTKIEDGKAKGPALRISFTDNRPGDSGDHIQRFFSPEEGDERMAGFHFAVIRNIVSMHNGALSAESGADGTTSFSIVFPLVEP